MNISSYFENLEKEVGKCYALAGKARQKGIDPIGEVEVPLAHSLAERVVGLVSILYPQIFDKRITKRIVALEQQHGSLDPAVALIIAEEIAKESYCKFSSHLEAFEAGVRVALGYLTLGYVSSPIEGFIQLKVKKTRDGKEFIAAYYSGPIRSAGGSEAAFSLVVVDYLRELFGYSLYDPSEEEVKRGIQECYEYHERVTNLQYLPSEEELDFLMHYLPIQLTGDPSEDKEVYNYKDLPRVETNFIRSGFALVIGEGLAQKAPKIFGRIEKLRKKGFRLESWDWLEKFVKMQKQLKEERAGSSKRTGATYIQDLVAGRPVFAHPSRSGAFRLRYGRARNTGYSTLAVHPATMAITNGFIAIGTQLKIEKPTKGCTLAVCDSIAGPIVKLNDGSVKAIKDLSEAKTLYSNVEEILYLGDLLVPYGDFSNRNHPLEKAGYVEQYWLEEIIAAGGKSGLNPSFSEACSLSKELGVSLHPEFIYFWNQISYQQFLSLLDWIAHAEIREGILVLPYTRIERERFNNGKRSFELLGCPHTIATDSVVLSKADTQTILFNLGIIDFGHLEEDIDKIISTLHEEDVLLIVNKLCSFNIRDKAGTFIGARMGRPEKAKLRVLDGSPHVLFPVGGEGGRMRSFIAALEKGKVRSDFPLYFCNSCMKESIYPFCENCGRTCMVLLYCRLCDKKDLAPCIEHGIGVPHKQSDLDIKYYFELARKRAGFRNGIGDMIVKGVRGTSNKNHNCEYLGKGLLRAKYNLHVNKDGTIRYDMTEMPLTHFKPEEIGTSIERLRELGYTEDIEGKELVSKDQLLEIFPHDLILPACPATPDEKADDVFLAISKFVDDELEHIYGLPRFYQVKQKEDLIGILAGCIAPHTASAVVGRIIGFSKVQALLASPYMHAAMRRDCDGDESAVFLLMDLLLNFSRCYLPSHRGGTQDAPLVLNVRIKANEVDDMIFDVDVSEKIPLALYSAAERHSSPFAVLMEQIRNRLGTGKEFSNVHYSYSTSDINSGPLCSSYKTLPSMRDKVEKMMELCKKIRAVDSDDVARLIIERHFIRDTRGNLRKFSQQNFRCVACNTIYRRPPLTGKCLYCGGRLIFTIAEGSILKYLQPALELARAYKVSPYLLESLELTEMYVQSIFGKEKDKQEALKKWF